jgi:MFS transporter, SP family, sugar:H+ symporter
MCMSIGSIAAVAMIYAIFFVPETKGRSLEELDELFERKPSVPAWRFRNTQTSGVGAKIGVIEGSDAERHDDALASVHSREDKT